MEKIHFSDIASVLGIKNLFDVYIENISTDTRTITKNSVFIAIKGENFDGSDYIDKAFQKGAILAVSESEKYLNDKRVCVVKNSIKALQDLASNYRKKFDLNVISITGSVGKTSTKEMIACILNGFDKTIKTKANLNNEIGVPSTLLNIDKSYKNAVIEMGTSDFGEIETLSKCSMPDVAVITNIGHSHIQTLKDRHGVFKAKSEIVVGLKKSGVLVLNLDDDILNSNLNHFNNKVLTYSTFNTSADCFASDIFYSDFQSEFNINYKGEKYKVNLNCVGEHNVSNAVCGFLVAVYLGYSHYDSARFISGFKNYGMRENIILKNDIVFIEDCYNASPDSMKSSISTLSIIKPKSRKIAVIGDMLELGESSEKLHIEVAKFLLCKNVDIVLTYGEMSKSIFSYLNKNCNKFCKHFFDKDELALFLFQNIKKDDVILFKASRGIKLEEVIYNLYKRLDND